MTKTKTIVVCSGGMDPIHRGHVEMIQEASRYGEVVILLNSDEWLRRKKGQAFMTWENRAAVLKAMRGVIEVIPFDDRDGTCVEGLKITRNQYKGCGIIFVNGGDRTNETTPEVDFCNDNGIALKFRVGGEKRDSSSNLLSNWKEPKTRRKWGHWSVLKEYPGNQVKVKELVVYPGEKLSFQRHKKRNELWFVAEGQASVINHTTDGQLPMEQTINKFGTFTIPVNTFHQLMNKTSELLHVVEIQWGEACEEEDIVRIDR